MIRFSVSIAFVFLVAFCGGVLQLIPTELHKAVSHTGGKAIERAMK